MFGKIRKAAMIGILILAVLITGAVVMAIAATNTMPSARADQDTFTLTADDLKPPECNGITLTNIVDVGAGETGTPANDLILGTDKADLEIRGGAGDDCILGGKGNERQRIGTDWVPGLYGEDGNDVLIGGPGNNDYCDGGNGTDTYYSCEVTY
jgi:Ca2+-binding RTX toxin-like protein